MRGALSESAAFWYYDRYFSFIGASPYLSSPIDHPTRPPSTRPPAHPTYPSTKPPINPHTLPALQINLPPTHPSKLSRRGRSATVHVQKQRMKRLVSPA